MTEILENIEITGQDHQGRGIVRNNDKVIFVENALPGEICDIEITKNNKKYQEAKAVRFVKKIQQSVTCPYYKECGGCNILHQKYEDQLQFKEKKLKEILKKFAGIEIDLEKIIFDKEKEYRNKIVLHNLGLYQKKSHNTIKVESCLLVHPKINEIIKRLQEFSKNSNNIIEEVMIRVGNSGETLLKITGKVHKASIKEYFQDIDVLILNSQLLSNKDSITDKIFDKKFKLSADSFYQVNRFVTPKLYKLVIETLKNKNIKTVLDLYCGVGTISLLVSSYVQKVIGIEVVKSAIENANNNKTLNNIENVEFIHGKVEDHIEKIKEVDAVIVDPPRKGLDQKTINTLLKLEPQHLIYVSCDPVTLARDLNILKEKYSIDSVTPTDMFPNTYHIECACVLKLK